MTEKIIAMKTQWRKESMEYSKTNSILTRPLLAWFTLKSNKKCNQVIQQ